MNKENKAMKEIEESVILTDYLIHHDLDFDDVSNFTQKTVKLAIEWKNCKDQDG